MGKKGARTFAKSVSDKTGEVTTSRKLQAHAQDSVSHGPSQTVNSKRVTGGDSLSTTNEPLLYGTRRGKANMPEGKRFQPGQSGNPGGRPSPRKQLTDSLIKEKLQAVEHRTGKTNAERLLDAMFRKALQGSFRCAELFLNYSLGKPVQQQVNVNREVTRDDRVAGMSNEEMDRRLLELIGEDYKALKSDGGPVQ